MKFLKLLVFLVLVVVAVSVADGDKVKDRKRGRHRNKVSYSVSTVWGRHNRKKDRNVQKWHDTIQSYHDGSEGALSEYEGDASALATVIMDTFRQYLTILMQFASANGTVLSGGATSILEAISRCSKYGQSSTVMLNQFSNIFMDVIDDLKILASKLQVYIGQISKSITNTIDEFSTLALKYVRRFLLNLAESGCQKELNYEPTQKKLLKLMSLVARIIDTLLKWPEPTIEVRHAVLVLPLMFTYFQVVGQGINAAVEDVKFKNNCETSQNSKSLSISFSNALGSVYKNASNETALLDKVINDILNDFVGANTILKTAVKDILGDEFDSSVEDVKEIARNLSKSPKVASTLTDILTKVASIKL